MLSDEEYERNDLQIEMTPNSPLPEGLSKQPPSFDQSEAAAVAMATGHVTCDAPSSGQQQCMKGLRWDNAQLRKISASGEYILCTMNYIVLRYNKRHTSSVNKFCKR